MIDLARERGIEVAVSGSDASEDTLFYLRAGATVEFLHGEAAERVKDAGGVVAQLYYAVN